MPPLPKAVPEYEAPTAREANLAAMLRRMIWMAEKETGDSSMKALAGTAKQLLASYGLQGSSLRVAGIDDSNGIR
jgi:hypothetical protein